MELLDRCWARYHTRHTRHITRGLCDPKVWSVRQRSTVSLVSGRESILNIVAAAHSWRMGPTASREGFLQGCVPMFLPIHEMCVARMQGVRESPGARTAPSGLQPAC